MKESTLAILKPDCVQKKLVGKVINHLLEAGFEIVSMKVVKLTRETAGEFYSVHKDKSFYNNLIDFMTESKVVPMVLEKENAVAELRKTIGATDPAEAEEGTIRNLFAKSIEANAIHGSDSDENAQIEASFFFSKTEMF